MNEDISIHANQKPLNCAFSLVILTCMLLISSGCITPTTKEPPPNPVEQKYKERLSNWLNNPLPPEARHSAHLFLSQDLINQVLMGVRDTEIPLGTTPQSVFKIGDVQTAFRDGFPVVRITGTLSSPGSLWAAEVDTYAVLEAIDEDQMKTPARLEFRLRFYHLEEASISYSSISIPELPPIFKPRGAENK